MSISLSKGGRVSLSKEAPGLKNLKVGLGWDANQTDTGSACDLDASVFLVGADGKVLSDSHFVFYGNLVSPDSAIEHKGDNTDGQGDGDDEIILINLDKVEAGIEKIIFTVTIHEAEQRNQNF